MFKSLVVGLMATSLVGTAAFAGKPSEVRVEKNKESVEKRVETKSKSEELREALERANGAKGVEKSTGVSAKETEMKASTEVKAEKGSMKSAIEKAVEEKADKKEVGLKAFLGEKVVAQINELPSAQKVTLQNLGVAEFKLVKRGDGVFTADLAAKHAQAVIESRKALGGELIIDAETPKSCLEMKNTLAPKNLAEIQIAAVEKGKDAESILDAQGEAFKEKGLVKTKEEGVERACGTVNSCGASNKKVFAPICARRGYGA